ncbi:MAG: PIG-L family deacetylase [Candidatus Aminicenantes bacterium]|nr:PIG-L family deacetylase [Candidatus Aminicenantes bacterium]
MKLNVKDSDIYVPDGISLEKALDRTTHLGVGAHPDDLEVLAFHGIIACYVNPDFWFTGVTCTNGSGSPRQGAYAGVSDKEMIKIRREEQREASRLGKYSSMLQLGYQSSAIKSSNANSLVNDLEKILAEARPQILYTHNPLDKHATHTAVCLAVLKAVRLLPVSLRPEKILGCEVWRDLDWLPEKHKVVLDVGGHRELESSLLSAFKSQIAGGKRYDLAVSGRRLAQATFLDTHRPDRLESAIYALDLTPLVAEKAFELKTFIENILEEFRKSVEKQLENLTGLLSSPQKKGNNVKG